MASKLDSIAIELAAIIGSYLDVSSVCSLRLVSKPLRRLFTPSFRPYLQHQSINLTEPSLERLCELAASQELGSAVGNLTLTCVYFLAENPRQDIPNPSPTGKLFLEASKHL